MDPSLSVKVTGYDPKEMKAKIGISSVKILDASGDRLKLQNFQQRYWIESQIKEKEERLQNELNEKKFSICCNYSRNYEQELLHVNQLRKQMEEEHNNRRKIMQVSAQQTNIALMKEKIDRELLQRKIEEEEKRKHIEFVKTNEMMNENPGAFQSSINPNRVIPSQYKGMSADQKKAIIDENKRQIVEKEITKKAKKDEENAYAYQSEYNRRTLINLERQKSKKLKTVNEAKDEFNKLLKFEQKERNLHCYD